MFKLAFVLLATAWLGGCASLAQLGVGSASSAYASYDARDAAPVERAVRPIGVETYAVSRRLFNSPTQRSPDRRLIYATAWDRTRSRHRRRRHARPRH